MALLLTSPPLHTPPSSVEAKYFYYGLHSKPRLIARSSSYTWVEPRGAEAYLTPKELTPLGFGHPLENLWEHKVGPEMVSYLDNIGVKCSSLDPVRIGYAGDSSHLLSSGLESFPVPSLQRLASTSPLNARPSCLPTASMTSMSNCVSRKCSAARNYTNLFIPSSPLPVSPSHSPLPLVFQSLLRPTQPLAGPEAFSSPIPATPMSSSS